ncbi:DUF4328 domain-containing protein [Streptomyces sp. KLOTTS4A1]|uniref:DUF4328 domain-containing protein n=1 Tax=Streptomyces sp. KLOTTS4A1 TaxID=3390996 RepID=UPI0039F5A56E
MSGMSGSSYTSSNSQLSGYPQNTGRPASTVRPSAYLKSPHGLAKALVILFGALIAADLFSLWVGFHLRSAMADLRATPFSEELVDSVTDAETLYGISGILQSALWTALIVVFLVWFWRVRVNAEVFGPEYQSMKRGWTIAAWFVPIANLWLPRRVASDIWGASETTERSPSQALLTGWWLLFVLDVLLGRFATKEYARAESYEEIRSAVSSLAVSDAVDIAACIAAILFVRRLTAMQQEKALRGLEQ